MRKAPPKSSATILATNPAAIAAMIAISRFLTKRISAALSYLSASWPALAENSTNGTI